MWICLLSVYLRSHAILITGNPMGGLRFETQSINKSQIISSSSSSLLSTLKITTITLQIATIRGKGEVDERRHTPSRSLNLGMKKHDHIEFWMRGSTGV